MNYRPKYFDLRELVDKPIYEDRGERAWELLRPDGLMMIDELRQHFGPITINNWHVGGPYHESGLRRFDTTTGAKYSMHKYGGAFDCKFSHCTPQEASAFILANPSMFPHLTTLENVDATPTWLHADCRNHDKSGIWVVNP